MVPCARCACNLRSHKCPLGATTKHLRLQLYSCAPPLFTRSLPSSFALRRWPTAAATATADLATIHIGIITAPAAPVAAPTARTRHHHLLCPLRRPLLRPRRRHPSAQTLARILQAMAFAAMAGQAPSIQTAIMAPTASTAALALLYRHTCLLHFRRLRTRLAGRPRLPFHHHRRPRRGLPRCRHHFLLLRRLHPPHRPSPLAASTSRCSLQP